MSTLRDSIIPDGTERARLVRVSKSNPCQVHIAPHSLTLLLGSSNSFLRTQPCGPASSISAVVLRILPGEAGTAFYQAVNCARNVHHPHNPLFPFSASVIHSFLQQSTVILLKSRLKAKLAWQTQRTDLTIISEYYCRSKQTGSQLLYKIIPLLNSSAQHCLCSPEQWEG